MGRIKINKKIWWVAILIQFILDSHLVDILVGVEGHIFKATSEVFVAE